MDKIEFDTWCYVTAQLCITIAYLLRRVTKLIILSEHFQRIKRLLI